MGAGSTTAPPSFVAPEQCSPNFVMFHELLKLVEIAAAELGLKELPRTKSDRCHGHPVARYEMAGKSHSTDSH